MIPRVGAANKGGECVSGLEVGRTSWEDGTRRDGLEQGNQVEIVLISWDVLAGLDDAGEFVAYRC